MNAEVVQFEIKGRPGVSFCELHSGRPFCIEPQTLSGVGSVNKRPDNKYGSTLYLRTHASARGASSAQNQSNGASR